MKRVSILMVWLSLLCSQLYGQGTALALSKPILDIAQHPKDVVVCEGGRAEFVVRLSGNDMPRFQWQSSIDGRNWTDIPKATTSVFCEWRDVTRVYDGLFVRVIVTNSDGEAIVSKPATLFIDGQIECSTQPESQLVVEGGTLHMAADFTSKGAPHMQWQYSPYGTGTWIDLEGETRQSLVVRNMRPEQSGGAFRVLAKNQGECDSTVSQTAFVEVVSKPVIEVNKGQAAYCGGSSTTLSIKMRGGSAHEKVQWQESRDGGKSFRNLSGATNNTYQIKRISEDMAGFKYRAMVALPGAIDLYTSEINLTVHGAIAFSKQPQSSMICPGDSIILSAKVDFKGSEPEYHWQASSDGAYFQDIPSDKSGKLQLSTSSIDRATRYFRVVLNAGACQSVTSEVARIDIRSTDGIEPRVRDAVVTAGSPFAELIQTFEGDEKVYAISWQWSANDGASWQSLNNPYAKRLVLKNPRKEVEGTQIYRVRAYNLVCGTVHYSEPAMVRFEEAK
jgi:hypothetical protein